MYYKCVQSVSVLFYPSRRRHLSCVAILVAPELFGAAESVHDELLDGPAGLFGHAGCTVLDLESSLARVDFARSVLAVDIFDSRDEGAVDALAFGGAASARVEGGEEVEAFSAE